MKDVKKSKNKTSSFKKIWNGDVSFIRKQLGLIALLVLLTIFYVSNRYRVQKQQIEISRLKNQLEMLRYYNLAHSSELMEITRQSKIEEYVQNNNSDLQTLTEPPYLIIDKKEK
jgi:endonuclease I